MLSFVRDAVETWRLQLRYRRLVQERLLTMAESTASPTDADEHQWKPASATALTENPTNASGPHELRRKARDLVARHPYARNLLRLLEIYVAGPGLTLTHRSVETNSAADNELAKKCEKLWTQFLTTNDRHWSYREHARRAWRDGETFVRKFPKTRLVPESRVPERGLSGGADASRELVGDARVAENTWPPRVRFIEPSQIDSTPAHPTSQGIVTADRDVETPIAYLRHESASVAGRTTVERIPAQFVMHSRYNADSNEPRGRSLLGPVVSSLDAYDRWLDTELQARRLQASIVLWRKVHGSPSVEGPVDADGMKRERVRPGSIVTTSLGTELEFLQPKTNFGDSAGLGRQLLLAIAAGIGVPEYMLTADASNANFSSTMVAEGPAVKLFQALQQWLADEMTGFWRWIIADAVESGLLPEVVFERVAVEWTFPTLIARDRPSERMADVALLDHGVLSRAEVARRDGVDPAQMSAECATDIEQRVSEG